MEATLVSSHTYNMSSLLEGPDDSDSTGTTAFLERFGMPRRNPQQGAPHRALSLKATRQHIAWASPDITSESADSEQIEATQQRIAPVSPDITPGSADSEQIFNAILSLHLSDNRTRDRKIADRLTTLYRDALEEDERILSASLRQFTQFFLEHHDLSLPRIILTPHGTLRVRWMQGTGSFTALEFTGKPLVQLVAEIPRAGGETARYFSDELVDDVVSYSRALGASFTCET
jgi:hypothetical protein